MQQGERRKVGPLTSKIYRLKSGEEIRWPKNHHGFVLVYAGRNEFGQRCYEIRKPTPEQKQALLANFVKRILIKEDGSMVFELDLFGYEPVVSMGSEDFKKVRINPSLLCHHCYQDTYEKVRVFFFLLRRFSLYLTKSTDH